MNEHPHQSTLPRAIVVALSVGAVLFAMFLGFLAFNWNTEPSNVAASGASAELETADSSTTTMATSANEPVEAGSHGDAAATELAAASESETDPAAEATNTEATNTETDTAATNTADSDAAESADESDEAATNEPAAGTTTTTAVAPVDETATPEPPAESTTTTATPATTTAPAPVSNTPSFEPVIGIDSTSPSSSWTKPGLFQTNADPAYGYGVTRLTTAEGTRFNRNTYSRRQAENADGTAFLTYHGDASYNVYRLSDGELISSTSIHPDGEPQWHPTNPNLIRHVSGNNVSTGSLQLFETNVATGRTTVIADLTSRVTNLFPNAVYMADRAEGSPSADGTRYAWIVFNSDENPIGIISYDLSSDQIGGSVPVDPGVEYRLDWVSASPTGNFVMAGYWEETLSYNFDMSNETVVFAGAEHSDIAIGPTGNDTYVYIDFTASDNGGYVVAVDLVTGDTNRYFDLYDGTNTSVHFSGKAYDRPGWIVVSTYSCKVEDGWACEKVFALNLADGTIVNLAHTYNCGADYWTETHAVTNRDLTRVYFNSDGGSCGTDAEVYQIDVPTLN